jgi:hypothetical protein
MSRIDSRHWKISIGCHFQNGHHNTAKIQHCPISSKFDMWVDNNVPNWFLTLKNFYRSPFSKWPPQYRTNSTSDFNDISYVGRLWCPELIPDIEKYLPVSIFKMVTTIRKIQHCSISKVAFDLFTDILSAVGLLSTGNRKHIIFCCCFMLYTTVLIFI